MNASTGICFGILGMGFFIALTETVNFFNRKGRKQKICKCFKVSFLLLTTVAIFPLVLYSGVNLMEHMLREE